MNRPSAALWIVTVALAVWIAVRVIPFVLADRETRRSMWQARVIR